MMRELDLWYALWDRVGSEGLDTWHAARDGAEGGGDLNQSRAADVDGTVDGPLENIGLGLEG